MVILVTRPAVLTVVLLAINAGWSNGKAPGSCPGIEGSIPFPATSFLIYGSFEF